MGIVYAVILVVVHNGVQYPIAKFESEVSCRKAAAEMKKGLPGRNIKCLVRT